MPRVIATKVRVPMKGADGKVHTAVFTKAGDKKFLCTPRQITIKGRTFMGRRGGRSLCGPTTGKSTLAASRARSRFSTCAHKHHGSGTRMRSCILRGRR